MMSHALNEKHIHTSNRAFGVVFATVFAIILIPSLVLALYDEKPIVENVDKLMKDVEENLSPGHRARVEDVAALAAEIDACLGIDGTLYRHFMLHENISAKEFGWDDTKIGVAAALFRHTQELTYKKFKGQACADRESELADRMHLVAETRIGNDGGYAK